MKKVTKSLLAATLVTSAIVPAISVAAEETVAIDKIIVTKDGKQYEISLKDYEKSVARGTFDLEISNIVINDKTYTLSQYERLVAREGHEKALTELATNGEPVVVEVEKGTFDPNTGEIKPEGTTPEENSIETFFYNLAA